MLGSNEKVRLEPHLSYTVFKRFVEIVPFEVQDFPFLTTVTRYNTDSEG